MNRIVDGLESIAPRILNRYYYYTRILPFALANSQQITYNKSNTIALFCNPRGGSTWLSDLVAHFAESASANEPEYRGQFHTNGTMPTDV